MPSTLEAQIPTIHCFLLYLFQLVPVTFTYLRLHCPCDVTTLNDWVGSLRVTGSKATGPGRVTGRKSWTGSTSGTSYHSPTYIRVRAVVCECGEGQTADRQRDRHRDGRAWPIYVSPRLRLTRNVNSLPYWVVSANILLTRSKQDYINFGTTRILSIIQWRN